MKTLPTLAAAALSSPPQSPVSATSRQVELRDLRLDYGRQIRGALPADEPVCVGLYVLTRPWQDPAARLAQARSAVEREDFKVVGTPAVDDTWRAEPATRRNLARLYAAVARGDLHGIVAASPIDISRYPGPYEEALKSLRTRGGFLALGLDEVAL